MNIPYPAGSSEAAGDEGKLPEEARHMRRHQPSQTRLRRAVAFGGVLASNRRVLRRL